ncbi:MAG: class I SAM-dependent methyltransferase, partial [Actinobacteria bacterium]|nr:class I SAM-dependent methyltransferase [Actinomycetota bacterium]
MTASLASRRWQRLVRKRLDAAALLSPDRDGIPPAFWDDRAERYARRVADTVAHDPLLPWIRPYVDADTVLLDVGAGTGRFSLALAAAAREVVALDPSEGMLRILTEQARAQGASNVRTVLGRLEDFDDVSGDVVLCAHVLPVLPDARTFLARLDRVARRRVFVYLGAGSSDLRADPLWRHFHGRSRPPLPTYLDAVAVLRELGITAQVEVVEVPTSDRYATVAEAVEDHLDLLRLDDSEQVRAELSELLDTWLI